MMYKSGRINSLKSVQIIDPTKYKEYLKSLSNNPEDLCIFVMAAAGLRVSEALSLHKKDITLDQSNLSIKVKVLKKRGVPTFRDVTIPLDLCENLVALLKHRKPQEFLFKSSDGSILNRQQIYRYCSARGVDCHSYRHSYISLLLYKGLTTLQIAVSLKIQESVVVRYSHLQAGVLSIW